MLNKKPGKPQYPKGVSLDRAKKRQIDQAYERAYAKLHPKGKSAQETLPFQQMYRDGICQGTNNSYSKTMQFEDINYQIAQEHTQKAIVTMWIELLHYFDDNVSVQMTFLNAGVNPQEQEKRMIPPLHGDELDPYRQEYAHKVLLENMRKGNNGLRKTKYITFRVHAEDYATARLRLNRIEVDIISLLKKMGVVTHPLDGVARLHLMRDILHMDGSQPFNFQWPMVAQSGLTPKDFIVPSSFHFDKKDSFQTGNTICQASYLDIPATDLTDRILVDFLDTTTPQVLTIHLQPISTKRAIKMTKSMLTSLSADKINHQKQAVSVGFDMDILPPTMVFNEKDTTGQLNALQDGERMFYFSLSIINSAKKRKELQSTVAQLAGVSSTHGCQLFTMDFMQEQAFLSSLPLAKNLTNHDRTILTKGLTAFIPFTTQELYHTAPDSIYIGQNPLSNNMIMVDRSKLANSNTLYLGTSGSGKSAQAKATIYQEICGGKDDVMICDPEAEYHILVRAFGGQIIVVSAASGHYINPMDINLNYGDGDKVLGLKASFIFSLCELMLERSTGLLGEERSGIDKCLMPIYSKYFANPIPENMPTLADLLEELKRQDDPNTTSVQAAMELYVTGSQNVFCHRTNVDIHNRLVCFDIKDLDNQLKKLGMLIVQDQVWNRVTSNRAQKKITRYYIDEFHLLLQEQETAKHFISMWKRFRKWGGVPTGITQNVVDLLASREVSGIFANSQFIVLLSQQGPEQELLAKLLNISTDQLRYISTNAVGEGLLYFGGIIIPFVNKIPKDTELYRLATTKLSEQGDLPQEE